MNKSINKILFWAPRILCIIFALFTAIFAIDVFNENYSFWKTILAFVMHLIPSGIIVLVLFLGDGIGLEESYLWRCQYFIFIGPGEDFQSLFI